MKLNTAYRVFNSAGESQVLEYTGSYFSGKTMNSLCSFESRVRLCLKNGLKKIFY